MGDQLNSSPTSVLRIVKFLHASQRIVLRDSTTACLLVCLLLTKLHQ